MTEAAIFDKAIQLAEAFVKRVHEDPELITKRDLLQACAMLMLNDLDETTPVIDPDGPLFFELGTDTHVLKVMARGKQPAQTKETEATSTFSA